MLMEVGMLAGVATKSDGVSPSTIWLRPHANIQPCGGIFSKVVKLLFKFMSFLSEL
jgi:hypothetical protein